MIAVPVCRYCRLFVVLNMDDNSSVVSDNVEKYADVMEYLASSAYPSGLSKNVKRALRQKAKPCH